MEKCYISVDVEGSGPTPGRYSMLSVGACVVGDTDKQFYAELKPISEGYLTAAMRVGCLGLHVLDKMQWIDEYDPTSAYFEPSFVLHRLTELGDTPQKAMTDFAEWVTSVSHNKRAVFAAAPVLYDGMFVSWYFDNFYKGTNPFGHSGEDMNSMCRGVHNSTRFGMKSLNMREGELTHNALDDAIVQAQEFEKVLEIMRTESSNGELTPRGLLSVLQGCVIENYVLDTKQKQLTIDAHDQFEQLVTLWDVTPTKNDPRQHRVPYGYGKPAFFDYKGWKIIG